MIDATAFTGLSAADQLAVCKALHIPTPTAALPLDRILVQEKLTPQSALQRLEQSRDMRALIAAACLKGLVTKCQPDAQFNPKPYPKIAPTPPVKRPVAATRAARAARVLVSVIPNPKQPGSNAHARYALYEPGLTEAELLAKGLRRTDFRWDDKRRHIAWRDA